MEEAIENLRFLSAADVWELKEAFDTPMYVYHQPTIEKNAKALQQFVDGVVVRYAMKSLPTQQILRLCRSLNLQIDASSGLEARRALHAGFEGNQILLTSQQLPSNDDLVDLSQQGVLINLCSLGQIDSYCQANLKSNVSLRFNPGIGTGRNSQTNTGGRSVSFGISCADVEQVKAKLKQHGLTVDRIHMHAGAGMDTGVWIMAVKGLLDNVLTHFPDVATLNVGGGFATPHMVGDAGTDLQRLGQDLVAVLKDFGRQFVVEIEPGEAIISDAGCIITTIQDMVSTKDGEVGHDFLKLDSGMTDILRPMLYGAHHPLVVVPRLPSKHESTTESAPEPAAQHRYVVVGHDCESGDLLTPQKGNPGVVAERLLTEAHIGSLCVIEVAGAYCSSMATVNFNSFLQSPEVLMKAPGDFQLIRQRQTLAQMMVNEL